MTKLSKTDILLVQLLVGETASTIMRSLGLSAEEANDAIKRRDELIDTYGESAFD